MTHGLNYLVAGSKPWNRRIYEEHLLELPGKWEFVGDMTGLAVEKIDRMSPRYIFFLHWSWIVPDVITDNYECVCFHMTDVPYGRGGSPLQNLIVRGHRSTRLTALRMVSELDAGPVYLKKELSLEGGAEEIYMRATRLSFEMIAQIVSQNIKPMPQSGVPTEFLRRTPSQSRIPELMDLDSLYDFIRMLDAEGYPKAFFEYHGFRFEFSRAGLYNEKIITDVTITCSKREMDK
jgi:methionyl-tRNA formyltransferase